MNIEMEFEDLDQKVSDSFKLEDGPIVALERQVLVEKMKK